MSSRTGQCDHASDAFCSPCEGVKGSLFHHPVISVSPNIHRQMKGIVMRAQWFKALTAILLAAGCGAMVISPAAAQSLTDWALYTQGATEEYYDSGGNPFEQHTSDEVGYIFGNGVKPSGFGTWMCAIAADAYRAQRLRLSAYIKTEDVAGWAGLWMRVDGPDREILAFDNMQNRTIRGTTDWKRYEIILDVPEEAEGIALGTILGGDGKVWTGSLSLDAVGTDVPVTDLGDPAGRRSPPKDIVKQMARFAGEWNGSIHQVMADGTEYDWPVKMDCIIAQNAFTVEARASVKLSEEYTIDWLGLYCWDASQKRVVYFETSSGGEVTILSGTWLDTGVPTLDLTKLERDGEATIHEVLTFPEDGSMEWDITWERDDSVMRQHFKARRQ